MKNFENYAEILTQTNTEMPEELKTVQQRLNDMQDSLNHVAVVKGKQVILMPKIEAAKQALADLQFEEEYLKEELKEATNVWQSHVAQISRMENFDVCR